MCLVFKCVPNSTLCNTWLAFFSIEERRPITEPTHYFIHRIASSPSYIKKDLISFVGCIQLNQLKNTNLRCKWSIWEDGALVKTLRKTVTNPQSLLTSWPFLHSRTRVYGQFLDLPFLFASLFLFPWFLFPFLETRFVV